MVELIKKKRDGFTLEKEEYAYIIDGFISGTIPDYQIAAFLMAVYFKGLTNVETAVLTDVMMRSGELIDLSDIEGITVDKHSTGGVGDKTTLILAPLVAAAGIPVPKMSGRGLGHTGGTIDKLEAIKGFSADMSGQEFIDTVKKHGLAICGQNNSLVPADKKLYALRDVTGTVDNISLIASSVMSKKLACGADAMVIDIKVGDGAYMKTEKEAEDLAIMMSGIGSEMNRDVISVISSMDEPLGYAIGNALEVKEAVDTLKGNGPEDLTALCMELGSHMLILGNVARDRDEAVGKMKALIDSGAAYEKFKEMIAAQGGDISSIEQPGVLPDTQFSKPYISQKEGYISKLNARDIGLASMALGAGRTTKESTIDHGAGVLLHKKIGDYVKKNDVLAIMHTNDDTNFTKTEGLMNRAFEIGAEAPAKKPLILNTIR